MHLDSWIITSSGPVNIFIYDQRQNRMPVYQILLFALPPIENIRSKSYLLYALKTIRVSLLN